jgi:hypothetical protein
MSGVKQMRNPGLFTVLAFMAFTNPVYAQSQDADATKESDKAEISMSFDKADSEARKIGDTIVAKLLISSQNVPSGASVYLAVLPLVGDALLTPEGGTLHATGLNFSLVANLQLGGEGGVFRIDRANYPEALLISSSDLETLAGRIWAAPTAKAICATFGAEGLKLVIGFLASFGRGGDGNEQAYFSFTLPTLEHHYDGVLLTPMLVRYEADGEQKIVFHSAGMHSLKISVSSD